MTIQSAQAPHTNTVKEAVHIPQNILPTYDARELTKTGEQAQILLGDQTYFLRITRAGKLILTK
jgi:hemin uptake protein HemP